MVGNKWKRILLGFVFGAPLVVAACKTDSVLSPRFNKSPAKNDSAGVSVKGMTTGLALDPANLNRCLERTPIRNANGRAVGATAKPSVEVSPAFSKRASDLMLVSLVSFATNRPGKATRQIDCVFENVGKEAIPFMMKQFGVGPTGKSSVDASENMDIVEVGGWSCYWFESAGKWYCYGGSGGSGGSNEMECRRPYQMRAGLSDDTAETWQGQLAAVAVGVYVCDNGCQFNWEDSFTYDAWGEGCEGVPPGPPSGPEQEWEEPGLECNPGPVQHGSDIDCNVEKADQGREYNWEFTSDSLSSPITKSNGGDNWSGPGVISGKVKVSYKWGNDRTGSRTKSITVSRRSGSGWNWDAGSLNALPQGNTSLDACIKSPETTYGLTVAASCATKQLTANFRIWQDKWEELENKNGWELDSITDGPNKGVHYVKSVSLIINMRWFLNPRYRANSTTTFNVTSASQPLYSACGYQGPMTVTMEFVHTAWYCVSDPTAYWSYKIDQVILPHEAEHGRLIKEAANDPSGANNPYKLFEPWVRQSHSGLESALKGEIGPMTLAIHNHSAQIDGSACAPGTGTILSNPIQMWVHLAGQTPQWQTCTSRFVLHR